MTYKTRLANKINLAKHFLGSLQSIISIGNLAPVGRFSPAMPHMGKHR